jgi:xanthine dehydrogenase YagS FAD-binding subunit
MRPFDYIRPETMAEAFTLLGQGAGGAQVLAGGTDLLPLMKSEITAPERLMDIKRLDPIPRDIAVTQEAVTLGALTTLTAIETHSVLQERYTLLPQAAALAATPQLRNMATLGGNLLQRPRCWYFRHPHIPCWLKGGDTCPAKEGQNQLHALFGGGPCYAVHPSDLAPALLALEAEVDVMGPNGERRLPLAEFFVCPETHRRLEVSKGEDELLLSVRLPSLPPGTRSTYLKAMDRKTWAFALVGVAATLRVDAQTITHIRLVLSGVAPIPWRLRAAEQLLVGQPISAERIAQAAEQALSEAEPLAHNTYKVSLAKHLIRHALLSLAADTHGHPTGVPS